MGSISDILDSFQSEGALCGQRAMTIECSLMSRCGRDDELVKGHVEKLWLKFPGLKAEVEIQVQKGVTGLNKTSSKYNPVVKGLSTTHSEA